VAIFRTTSSVPGQRFAAALNGKLPKSITITSSCDVPAEFHPRKNALSKKYRFRILNRLMRPALLNNRVFHFPPELDIAVMREATRHLVGKHDFKSFTVASSIKEAGYVREIYSLEVLTHGQEVIIEVCGSGFLHNMVRIIAGTLLDVGRGRLKPADIPGIIKACNRKMAGPTLPGNGLYLVEVNYAEDTPSE
jgi:tRNA pseudouridine38-40 synthase